MKTSFEEITVNETKKKKKFKLYYVTDTIIVTLIMFDIGIFLSKFNEHLSIFSLIPIWLVSMLNVILMSKLHLDKRLEERRKYWSLINIQPLLTMFLTPHMIVLMCTQTIISTIMTMYIWWCTRNSS
jgi:hypothetical protein